MGNFSFARRRIQLLVALLFVENVLGNNSSLCSRESQNKNVSATFLCAVSATFVRFPNCTALISEKFVFPHTTGKEAFREFPYNAKTAKVSVLTLRRDKVLIPWEISRKDNRRTVTMKTVKSPSPVVFELTYAVQNAIRKSPSALGTSAKRGEESNQLVWATGTWNKTVDNLSVRFVTRVQRAKLSLAKVTPANRQKFNVTGAASRSILLEVKNVTQNVRIVVKEVGALFCGSSVPPPSNFGDNSTNSGLPFPAIIFIVLVSFFAVIGFVSYATGCGGRTGARGESYGGFSAGAGFDGGGGSGCGVGGDVGGGGGGGGCGGGGCGGGGGG